MAIRTLLWRGLDAPRMEIVRVESLDRAYGTQIGIAYELRWALDPLHPFDEEQAFFEIYPGKFVDAHLNHALKPTDLETLRARRRAIGEAYRQIADCRVVGMTLNVAALPFLLMFGGDTL